MNTDTAPEPTDLGYLGYPPPMVDALRKLAVDSPSSIDDIDSWSLLDLTSAIIDLMTAKDRAKIHSTSSETIGRVLHVALQRGVLRADARAGIHDDDDHDD